MDNPTAHMDGLDADLAAAGNRIAKLERLLISCKAAMVADMSDRRIMIGRDWSHMILAIEEAVPNAELRGRPLADGPA